MTLENEIVRQSVQRAPVDITALADRLGIPVFQTSDLPEGVSGKIVAVDKAQSRSGYKIFINNDDPYTRQRFTIAHEIAHYLLHREKIGDELSDNEMYRSGNVTARDEVAANNMAADLLMPRSLVLEKLKENSTYSRMARLFDVSVPAMKARLKYLLYL